MASTWSAIKARMILPEHSKSWTLISSIVFQPQAPKVDAETAVWKYCNAWLARSRLSIQCCRSVEVASKVVNSARAISMNQKGGLRNSNSHTREHSLGLFQSFGRYQIKNTRQMFKAKSVALLEVRRGLDDTAATIARSSRTRPEDIHRCTSLDRGVS